MPDAFDDRLDRFVAGELSAREQRELAQAALDDPALFDTLTTAALVSESARGEAPAAASQPVVRPKPRLLWLAAAGAAMAAAAAIGVIVIRRPSPVSSPSPTQAAAADAPKPASRAPERLPLPIFLTARADTADLPPSAFRNVDAGSRPPNNSGTVSLVDGDEIDITLGSLDGLAKGSAVRIVRQGGRGPAATLVVDMAFRERSRGRMQSGPAPQIGDRAEVSATDHVNALLQHAAAREAAGDLTSARRLAELAVASAEAGDMPSDVRRRARADLAMLEQRAGALDDAIRHLRAAADELDRAPAAADAERARVLNALGSALVDKRAYDDAAPILQSASAHATGRTAVRIANNLAAIAAIRGDRAAAEALYQSALRLAGDSADLESDRRAIQSNLDALRSSR